MRQVFSDLFESGVSYDAYTMSSVLPQFGRDPFSHFRKQCDKYNKISDLMIYFSLSLMKERDCKAMVYLGVETNCMK